MLRHGIRTGQYGCHVAQERQKTSNENEPAAISQKEPLTDSDPSFGDAETRPVSHQQLVAESPANPKADNLAEYCCDDSSSDQRGNFDAVRPGGEKARRNQSGLGRQRDANAFERDECRHYPDAVDGHELGQTRRSFCLLGGDRCRSDWLAPTNSCDTRDTLLWSQHHQSAPIFTWL